MKDSIVVEKNVKIPLYVTVYETISGWLKEGKYKPGDKLPGENFLSEQLEVSRGTLRQAMLLLQEDGLIANHQGKGNIVLSNHNMSKYGLEKTGNPIVEFYNGEIIRTELSIGFQPATRKHQEVLKLRASSIVAVIDITYYGHQGPAGFAMIYMPSEILDHDGVNFEDTDTVYQYYNELLTSGTLYSDTRLRIGQARERTAGLLDIQEGDAIMIMEEVLYSEFDMPVLSQKLFFAPEQYELHIMRRRT